MCEKFDGAKSQNYQDNSTLLREALAEIQRRNGHDPAEKSFGQQNQHVTSISEDSYAPGLYGCSYHPGTDQVELYACSYNPNTDKTEFYSCSYYPRANQEVHMCAVREHNEHIDRDPAEIFLGPAFSKHPQPVDPPSFYSCAVIENPCGDQTAPAFYSCALIENPSEDQTPPAYYTCAEITYPHEHQTDQSSLYMCAQIVHPHQTRTDESSFYTCAVIMDRNGHSSQSGLYNCAEIIDDGGKSQGTLFYSCASHGSLD